jgi:hypothetical protein
MTPKEKALIAKMGEALDFCMNWAMSKKIGDDEEYSKMVDLQNEIKEMVAEVCK